MMKYISAQTKHSINIMANMVYFLILPLDSKIKFCCCTHTDSLTRNCVREAFNFKERMSVLDLVGLNYLSFSEIQTELANLANFAYFAKFCCQISLDSVKIKNPLNTSKFQF